jgi:hypothetical protein
MRCNRTWLTLYRRLGERRPLISCAMQLPCLLTGGGDDARVTLLEVSERPEAVCDREKKESGESVRRCSRIWDLLTLSCNIIASGNNVQHKSSQCRCINYLHEQHFSK